MQKMTEIPDKVYAISKTCIKLKNLLQKNNFSFKTVCKAVKCISRIAGLVIDLEDALSDDSVMVELQELGKKIDALSNEMNSRFDDMKAFISESNFHIISTPNLIKYMINCLEHPEREEAFLNFKNAYNQNSPLNMTYTMMNLLEKDATNPLKKAMDADPLKTKATFDKWVVIIDRILAQFLLLEAFAVGVLRKTSNYDWDQIIREKEKLFNSINQWGEEYKNNGSYWPGLKKYIEECLDTHKYSSLKVKSDEVAKILETIWTNDAFYIVLFKEGWFSNGIESYHVSVEGQLIEISNRGNCSALIYRSKQANFVEDNEFVEWEKKVDSVGMRPQFIFRSNEERLKEFLVPNAGFVCKTDGDSVKKWANCRKRWGPGCFWNPLLPYFSPTGAEDIIVAALTFRRHYNKSAVVGYI